MSDTRSAEPGQIRQEPEPEGEHPAIAPLKADRDKAAPRHRTARRAAYQGGAVGALGTVATVAHAFGPAGVAVAAGTTLAAVGVRAYSKRTGTKRAARKRTLAGRARAAVTRTVSRRTLGAGRTAGALHGRRTGAYRRAHGGATGTLGRRVPNSAGIAAPRTRRTARAGGARRGGAARYNRRPLGRTRTAGPAGTAAGRRHGGLSAPSTGRAARATRRRAAAARRPAGTAPRSTAAARARHSGRTVRAQVARGTRAGIAAGKRYTRLTDPAHTPKHAKGKTAPAPPRKTGPENTAPAQKKTAAKKTTPPKGATKKTAKGAPAKPGHALTAPGQKPKARTIPVTTAAPGIAAATEAIREHVGGFQPESAFDIAMFFGGLHELYTELGSALTSVSERLADEEPIDAAVTDHLRQMAGHTASLADWGSQTESLFRRAHEVELGRLENPRRNEEHWDVTRNQ